MQPRRRENMKRVREGEKREGRNVRRKERKEGSDGRNEALEIHSRG